MYIVPPRPTGETENLVSTELFYLIYAVAIFLILAVSLLYLHCTSLYWEEPELRALQRLELHLAQILSLLEAPDVGMLMKNRESRQLLLLEFSENLRADVVELWGSRKLDLNTLAMLGAFFCAYYGMRLKSHLWCGEDDLRFLAGMELLLCRRLEELD